jgi:two-component system alkaline phosphatase synthesis response regulator PhoP
MPKTILVVDDERHIVRLIQVNLEGAGYTVVTASDGREGLEKVESYRPDLVVLDVHMPHVDGFEMLHNLRSKQSTRDMPVLMLMTFTQDIGIIVSGQTPLGR